MLQSVLGFHAYLVLFARYKIRTLHHDQKEADFFAFLKLLPDKGVILDIGANLGIMTWHMLRHFKKAAIWAFEPIPENNAVLLQVTANSDQKRLRIFPLALGEESGRTTMVLPEIDAVRMQGLSHVLHESIEGFDDGREYEVDLSTIDALTQNQQVVGVKLDVENYEYYVLMGGVEMLKRCMPLIYMELWDNDNRQRCMELLEGLGYQICYFNGKDLKPYRPEVYTGQNFFALPKGDTRFIS